MVIPFWSNEYGGTIAVVDELYVKPIWRRRGCARQFFAFITENPEKGIMGLQVTVTPTNSIAGELYRRMGFMETGNAVLVKKLN